MKVSLSIAELDVILEMISYCESQIETSHIPVIGVVSREEYTDAEVTDALRICTDLKETLYAVINNDGGTIEVEA